PVPSHPPPPRGARRSAPEERRHVGAQQRRLPLGRPRPREPRELRPARLGGEPGRAEPRGRRAAAADEGHAPPVRGGDSVARASGAGVGAERRLGGGRPGALADHAHAAAQAVGQAVAKRPGSPRAPPGDAL
ncbi:unnamed protein product, partial [Prorocentrum cordatum]